MISEVIRYVLLKCVSLSIIDVEEKNIYITDCLLCIRAINTMILYKLEPT